MARILVGIIKIYQLAISPILGARCRFHPSCSQYALEAIEKHGAVKGAGFAIYRLVRCQPFCAGGFDPIP